MPGKYTKKSKRTYRKKSTKISLYRPKLRMLNTHHFKAHYIKANYLEVFMTGADKMFSYSFQLNDVPNKTEFQNLFDEYRINAVLFELKPRYVSNLIMSTDPATLSSTTNMVTANNLGLPEVNTVIDLNDATAPATTAELVEYQTFKQTRGNAIHKRKVIPRVAIAADPAGVGAVSMAKRWVNSNQLTIDHFGLKGSISNVPNINIAGANPSFFIDLHITYYVSCKNTK